MPLREALISHPCRQSRVTPRTFFPIGCSREALGATVARPRRWGRIWKPNRAERDSLHEVQPAGFLYHSDRGVQDACGDFRAVLAAAHLVASMSRKGHGYDNAAMKSFWSSFKRDSEMAHR